MDNSYRRCGCGHDGVNHRGTARPAHLLFSGPCTACESCSAFTEEQGWHVIQGDDLLALLRRASSGENPDLLLAEQYANARHEETPMSDETTTHACPTCGDVHCPPSTGPETFAAWACAGCTTPFEACDQSPNPCCTRCLDDANAHRAPVREQR